MDFYITILDTLEYIKFYANLCEGKIIELKRIDEKHELYKALIEKYYFRRYCNAE